MISNKNLIFRNHMQIFFPSRFGSSFRILHFLVAGGGCSTLRLLHGGCYVDRERIGDWLINWLINQVLREQEGLPPQWGIPCNGGWVWDHLAGTTWHITVSLSHCPDVWSFHEQWATLVIFRRLWRRYQSSRLIVNAWNGLHQTIQELWLLQNDFFNTCCQYLINL